MRDHNCTKKGLYLMELDEDAPIDDVEFLHFGPFLKHFLQKDPCQNFCYK